MITFRNLACTALNSIRLSLHSFVRQIIVNWWRIPLKRTLYEASPQCAVEPVNVTDRGSLCRKVNGTTYCLLCSATSASTELHLPTSRQPACKSSIDCLGLFSETTVLNNLLMRQDLCDKTLCEMHSLKTSLFTSHKHAQTVFRFFVTALLCSDNAKELINTINDFQINLKAC